MRRTINRTGVNMATDIAKAAWDEFSRDPGEPVKKASIQEQLDTLAAQLNEIKINSERSAQMIPGLMGDSAAIETSNDGASEMPQEQPPQGMPPEQGMPEGGEMPSDSPGEMVGEEGAPEEEDYGDDDFSDLGSVAPDEGQKMGTDNMGELVPDNAAPMPEMGAEAPTDNSMSEEDIIDALQGNIVDDNDVEGDDMPMEEYPDEGAPEEVSAPEGAVPPAPTDMPAEDAMPMGQTDRTMGLDTKGENLEVAFKEFLSQYRDAIVRASARGDTEAVRRLVEAMSQIEEVYDATVVPAMGSDEESDAFISAYQTRKSGKIAKNSMVAAPQSNLGSGQGIAKSDEDTEEAATESVAESATGGDADNLATNSPDKNASQIEKEFKDASGEAPKDSFSISETEPILKGKPVRSIKEMMSVKKSEGRPELNSSVNGDIIRPELSNTNAVKPIPFKKMMEMGGRPRDLVANDLKEYKAFKATGRYE